VVYEDAQPLADNLLGAFGCNAKIQSASANPEAEPIVMFGPATGYVSGGVGAF